MLLHCTSIQVIKSWNTRQEGYAECVEQKINSYKTLVGKPEGRKPLVRLRQIWECGLHSSHSG